mgnify:CR=1 FL=1
MRVVQFCESFSPFSETFIYDTVRELDRQGVECHVVTLNRLNESDRPYNEDRVHVTPWPGRWDLARLWARLMAAAGIRGDIRTHKRPLLRARMREKIEQIKPDAVHAQFGPMGTLIAPITNDLDIPLIVTFHGYDISILPQQKEIREGYRDLFKKADCLIGVSNHNADKVEALGAPSEKVCVLHNGTDIENFSYSNPTRRYDGGTVRLLHVGRLVEKKSPLDLVEAFRSAREQLGSDVSIHLTIAGGGPLIGATEKRIRSLNLGGHIDCLGAVPHAKVQELMQTCHLYTQHCKTAPNGDQEGQGVTFVEAQASGLPVITTRHNGIPDVVIDGKTGYLVEEGDTEAMAERIAYLAKHPEKWSDLGQAGRAHVEANFDLSKQIKKMKSFYSEVIK